MQHLNKSFKLVKLEVQLLKALSEQVAQAVLVHDSDKDTERLLFRHLNTHTHTQHSIAWLFSTPRHPKTAVKIPKYYGQPTLFS